MQVTVVGVVRVVGDGVVVERVDAGEVLDLATTAARLGVAGAVLVLAVRAAPVGTRAGASELDAARRTVPAGPPLTAAERSVLALVAEGLSNAGIATRLSLSRKTIEAHLSSVFAKLGLDEADGRRNRRVAAALHWHSTAG